MSRPAPARAMVSRSRPSGVVGTSRVSRRPVIRRTRVKTETPEVIESSEVNGSTGANERPGRRFRFRTSAVPPIRSSVGGINRRPARVTTAVVPDAKSESFEKYQFIMLTDEMVNEANMIDPGTRQYSSPVVRAKKRIGSQILLFHKAVVNVLRMLNKQGYIVPKQMLAIQDLSPVQFIEIYTRLVSKYNSDNPVVDSGINKTETMTIRRALSGAVQHPDGHYIYLYYPEPPTSSKTTGTVDVKKIGEFLTDTLKQDNSLPPIRVTMMIAELPLSNPAAVKIGDYPSIRFRFFRYDQLTYLPSEHFMTPLHTKMTNSEIKVELTGNGVNLSRLKTMAQDDPIVREMGFKVGDILRIKRTNLLYGHLTPITYDYRRVVRIEILLSKTT
jgi:DNA-directed RNA polymerase subunit H (RpoH/RPB5)